MSIGFDRPLLVLLGFLVLPLSLFLGRRFFRELLQADVPLGPPGGEAFRPPFDVKILVFLLRGMEYLGCFFFFAAASGPHLVSSEPVWLNRGADIIFVIDVSPSMAGVDMDNRNRFDAARDLVRGFAANRPSDAIGLVGVGNEASLLIPPTIDRDILYERLEKLRIGELGDGTALGTGLALAALHMRNSTAPRRAAVLITDGENNAGPVHPETAAAAIAEAGASLWVIGIGSFGEVPIDYVDPQTNMRRTGSFESRFNPESLRAIARKGGGTYIAAPSGAAFSAAFGRLDESEMVVRRSGAVSRNKSISGPFILAALFLLLTSRIIRRWHLGAFL